MKIYTLFLLPILAFCMTAVQGYGQEDARLIKLQEKLEAAEASVFSADSLLEAGQLMVKEAEAELKALAQEEKEISREHFNARKPIEKQLKSKDPEVAKQAKFDLKNLESQNKEDIKEWNDRYKISIKKYDTGNKMVEKGKVNLKKAKEKKKQAEKALEDYESKK